MSWISLERLEKKPEITGNEVEAALGFATRQVIRNLPRFTDRFQKAYSENGFYEPTENVDWTPGFWTGGNMAGLRIRRGPGFKAGRGRSRWRAF